MTLREWAERLERAEAALDDLRGWNTTAPSFVIDEANDTLAAIRAAKEGSK